MPQMLSQTWSRWCPRHAPNIPLTENQWWIWLSLKQLIEQSTIHKQTNGKLWLCFKGCKYKNPKENNWQCHYTKQKMHIGNAQWRKVKQMQPMWLCILKGRPFEETHESTHWRKVEQMQLMWLCFLSGKQFEDTHENAQWIKVKQMQPMWLCLFPCKRFEETFENAQCRKVKQMQPMWLCLFSGRSFEDSFENSQWRQTSVDGGKIGGKKVTDLPTD